jgi:hypothetical protein
MSLGQNLLSVSVEEVKQVTGQEAYGRDQAEGAEARGREAPPSTAGVQAFPYKLRCARNGTTEQRIVLV